MTTLVPFWTIEPRHVQLAMLAMIRLSGLLLLAPPVQAPLVPVMVRVGLAFSLVFLLWNQLVLVAPPVATDILTLGGLAASELGVGLAIGFAARLVLSAASYAAELLSMKMGFGLATLIDPFQGQATTVLTRIFDLTVMVIFLALDGHHLLIGATVESFRVVPPGRVADLVASADVLIPLGGRLFGVGLAMVAPALGVLLLANLALVLASRVVPNLHLMAVGFPVLIGLGLLMTIVNLDLLGALMAGEIRHLESALIALLRSFGHGR
jgi:flagellar biosynthetic protein FliR